MPPSPLGDPVVITPAVLRSRPLPDHRSVETKYDRGVVVVIGGSAQTPGGVLLAGLAALRVGAGKVQLATAASAAAPLAIAVPEARVIGLPETANGSLRPAAADQLAGFVAGADAVLVGTSAFDDDATGAMLHGVLPAVRDAVVIVDAAAIPVLADDHALLGPLGGRAIVMPNPKEMADLLGCSLDEVTADPAGQLAAAVDRLGVTVTLRGTETWTAAPGGPLFRDEAGNAGLATSGSGDVLAGAIAGLAARGADPVTATIWATHIHGVAADRCAARLGEFGYLARELLDELPLAHAALGG
jgi:ADP-dependent NAD(P)H-hydrate dehydratase